MDFNKITPKAQIPVLWNWDRTNVVGTATVHENGDVNINMIPTEFTRRFFDMVTKNVVRSFSVGFTADLNKADKLQARVDEWQPVRDFLKKEAAFPFLDSMKEQMERDMKAVMKPLETYQEKALRLVFEYIKPRLEKTDKHVTFAQDEVYVVWFSKTLQNWKCLISTTLPDGMYYEVTYNGDQHETYIDAYKKFDNVRIVDPEKREQLDKERLEEDRNARAYGWEIGRGADMKHGVVYSEDNPFNSSDWASKIVSD